MARRIRFWLRTIFLTLFALLLIAALLGWLYWQHLREQFGIEQLELKGVELDLDQLLIADLRIDLNHPGLAVRLHARELRLTWARSRELGWHFEALNLQQLEVFQHPPRQPSTEAPEGLQSLDPEQLLPRAVPRHVAISEIALDLPCQQTRCRLQGALRLDPEPHPQLHVSLNRGAHRLDLHAWSGASALPTLEARLEIDGEPSAHLRSTWQSSAVGNTWNGKLELPARGDTAWLWEWLEEWLGTLPPLDQAPGSLALSADWLLQLTPGALDLQRLLHASGHLDLQADLPAPWPVPGVGPLQGQAVIQLLGTDGSWQARQLQAQLQLNALDPQLLGHLPEGADPGSLQLQISAEEQAFADNTLGLKLQVASSGPLHIEGQAQLHAQLDPQAWELRLNAAKLQLRAAELRHPDVRIQGMQAQLTTSGLLNQHGLQLHLQPGSQVQATRLTWLDPSQPVTARQLQLQLDGLQWASGLDAEQTLLAPIDLRIDALEHSALRSQGWDWRGNLQYDNRLVLDGTLYNDAGLTLRTRAQQGDGSVLLDGQLNELHFAGGNPLQRTLTDWPSTLELSAGSMRLEANAVVADQRPLQARASMRLSGVAGIFDRSELQGVDAQLQLDLRNERLQIGIEQLQIAQLNPGVPLQTVALRGDYTAAIGSPTIGRLNWQQAQAQLFNGRIWLDPGTLDLAADNPARSLHVQGISLAQLLQAYPAEGLEGDGNIDGELPLRLTPDGLSIADGTLAARAPGGRLHFSSPKLDAFGASNPALGLVVQALSNFHYSRLESGVDYSEQGTLQLALRLEGENPQIENGRPIHFNINIEEDIPALLTSLQLSGKVSERIQQRVQERMREAESATP